MKFLTALLFSAAVWVHAVAITPITLSTPAAPAGAPPAIGPDLDGDGLSDLQEIRFGSDPTKPDTDGDGFNDKQEYDAQTDPRDREKFPLFLLSLEERQLLVGDTLVLRAKPTTNFIVITNIFITTNPPPTIGTPIDTDGDGVNDSCDADGDGVADSAGDCPTDGEPTIVTNRVVVTNYVAWQWFLGTNALPTQTNSTLLLLQAGQADAGNYHLYASLLKAEQTGKDVPVKVSDFPVKNRLPQPAGRVVAWGNNIAKQTNAPTDLTNVVQVAAGFLHSLALLPDGRVAAWGDGGLGQTNISLATNVTAISAGSAHSLALLADSTVAAWGTNDFGQCDVPPGLTNVVAISAGYFHSVALLADGSVVCWGDNSLGQCDVPDFPGTVKSISAGLFHNAAILTDGSVVCWGNDAFGESTVPSTVTDPVAAVSAGGSHTVALMRDGTLQAWGRDDSGQWPFVAGSVRFVAVSAGYNFTTAITVDGKVMTWGSPADPVVKPPALTNGVALNGGYFHAVALVGRGDADADGLDDAFERQLGSNQLNVDTDADGVYDGIEARVGSSVNYPDTDGDGLPDKKELENQFDPTVATEAPDGSMTLLPAVELEYFSTGRYRFQLQGSSNQVDWVDLQEPFRPGKGVTRVLTNLTAGVDFYRLVPLAEGGNPPPVNGPAVPVVIGTVATFGNDELGQGEVPVTLGGVSALSAGVWHTLALLQDGTVTAWGLNSDGQCEVPAGLAGVTAVAGGGRHSLALRVTGEIVAWGNDDYGQAAVPQLASAATAIAAGGSHSLALLLDGTVVAWGANDMGQTAVPAGLSGVASIAAGRFHSVAVRADGSVVCWGDNRSGQCSVPAGLPPVASVAAGFSHTAALLRDGRVVCWGNNTDGQGDVPAGLAGVTAVYAGNTRTVARTAAGQYVVWGEGAATLEQQINAFGAPSAFAVGGVHVSAAVTAVDADADGVDDQYEVRLGTDPTKLDTDGDGLDDQTEILAGFDPLRPTEAVDGTLTAYPAFKLRFFTLAGSAYRLERSSDLVSWRTETAFRPFAGKRGFGEILQSFRTRERHFWRLLDLTTDSGN